MLGCCSTMHAVLFVLVYFLALHVCWLPVAGAPTYSPTSMALNNTLNVPISSTNDIQPPVQIALFSLDTYRAFYFISETPPQIVEVFLPPEGDMVYVNTVNVTYPSGTSNSPIYISQVLQVPPTTYDPESNYVSTIYLCSSSTQIILEYVVTTPPFSEVPQPSTFQYTAYVTLPSTIGGVDTFLLVDDYLYLSGLAFLQVTSGYIMAIPLNNFTNQYMADVQLIYVTGVTSLGVATTNGTFVFYGANANLAYRVSVADFELDTAPLQLTGVSTAFTGAFTDPEIGFVYFLSSDDRFSALVRVDTLSFTQFQEPLQFNSNVNLEVLVHDTYGGHVYFGHYLNPALITNVNLETFQVESVLTLDSPLAFLQTALLDADHSWAYFNILSNFSILKIQLPLPCAGLDTSGNSIELNNCSYPNGYCEYATCHCYPDVDYEGTVCSSLKCLNDCYRDAANNTDGQSHGTCNNGTCVCSAYYTGADCGQRQCKNGCQGRGECSSTLQCICGEFWFGDDCSEFIPIPPCDELHSCHACATNTSCGWCSDNNQCIEGDSFGPLAQLCERYSYLECPSLFFFSFAYVLTVVCWLLMLGSAILTIIQDYTLPENTKTKRFVQRFWWKNQLAAKTLQMVEYIQMLAITGYIAVDMPAPYSEFILPFQWSILHLPYPFSHPTVIRPPSRDLLTFFAEGRVVHSEAYELFLGNLFYYALVIVVLLVLFAVPVVLIATCMSEFSAKEKIKQMAKSRIIYCFIRLNQFAFFPLVVTSLFTLTWYSHAPSRPGVFKVAVVLSAITLLCIGLAFPIVTFFKIYKEDKELFSFEFSRKYGSLYQKYHFKKGYFNSIQLCKLLIIAVWIALLYRSPVPQLILIAATHLVYFVVLLTIKPYADHIHYFTDLVVTALEVVFFLLILGFRDSTAQRYAMGVVVVHILALCVIIVGICSNICKMNGIFGLTDLKRTSSNKSSTSDALTAPQND